MLREVLYFEDVIYRLESLMVYNKVSDDGVMRSLSELAGVIASDQPREVMTAKYYVFARNLLAKAEELGFSGHLLRQYVMYLFLKDKNLLSLACNNGIDVKRSTLYTFAVKDMGVLQYFMDFDLQNLCDNAGYGEKLYNYIPTVAHEYPELDQLGAIQTAQGLLDQFIWLYSNMGVGDLGGTSMFRVDEDGELVPIRNHRSISFSSFSGYKRQIDELKANTQAFLKGKPANTLLLTGSPSVGKYACLAALGDQYSSQNLRVIEVGKDRFRHLEKLMSSLGKRRDKFIVVAEDLSNADIDQDYDCLKYCLGTSFEMRPNNVLFYATSNCDLPTGYFDEVIEFSEMTVKEFQDAVADIASKMKVSVPTDFLKEQALAWVSNKPERSVATAREYVKQVIWELKQQ